MNFKVKCVRFINDTPQQFTVGNVYDVVDGTVISDTGFEYHAWSFPMNGSGDFNALKEWFKSYYTFELVEDKKVFTAKDLKTGMFGVMTDGSKFVVVDKHIVYQDGNYDLLTSFTNSMGGRYYAISKVWSGLHSFDMLEEVIANNNCYGRLEYDRTRNTKPLYNGKVVCVDLLGLNSNFYTVGKIYQFKDGVLTADDGTTFGNDYGLKFHTFKDWDNWSSSKFIEIKE